MSLGGVHTALPDLEPGLSIVGVRADWIREWPVESQPRLQGEPFLVCGWESIDESRSLVDREIGAAARPVGMAVHRVPMSHRINASRRGRGATGPKVQRPASPGVHCATVISAGVHFGRSNDDRVPTRERGSRNGGGQLPRRLRRRLWHCLRPRAAPYRSEPHALIMPGRAPRTVQSNGVVDRSALRHEQLSEE
jgi:hypothetical protein